MFKIIEAENKIQSLNIENLNKNHLRALVCGSSGSGKTTFILNYIFQNIKTYKLILYYAPTETLESGFIKSIRDNKLFDKYIYFFDIRKEKLPSISDLQELYKTIKKNSESPRIALIFDDFINVLTSKQDKKQIDAYLTQSSRANCDLFLLVQTYNNISPSIASNINLMVLFPKYMSRDSFNACEYDKKIGDVIYNKLRHLNSHIPFIFINDQPPERSILYNNYFLDFMDNSSDSENN